SASSSEGPGTIRAARRLSSTRRGASCPGACSACCEPGSAVEPDGRPGRDRTRSGGMAMPVIVQTVLLLVLSNVFMTFAWYAHLKELQARPWYVAAVASWGIALFEYLAQVPANRIGHRELSVGQLKILQEVITLSVFVPIAALYLKEPVR